MIPEPGPPSLRTAQGGPGSVLMTGECHMSLADNQSLHFVLGICARFILP